MSFASAPRRQAFYHASFHELPLGTVLRGDYGEGHAWRLRAPVSRLLEARRPAGQVSRTSAVFATTSARTAVKAGGGTDYVYEVEPVGPLSGPFDSGWHSEISRVWLATGGAMDADLASDPRFAAMADAYWAGEKCRGKLCAGRYQEYLMPSARIVRLVGARAAREPQENPIKGFRGSVVKRVVYHGTDVTFDELKRMPGTRGAFGGLVSYTTQAGGFFFTPSKKTAREYGKNVIAARINIQKPLTVPGACDFDTRASQAIKQIYGPFIQPPDPREDWRFYGHLNLPDFVQHIWKSDAENWPNAPAAFTGKTLIHGCMGLPWALLDEPTIGDRMLATGYDGTSVYEPRDEPGYSWFVPSADQVHWEWVEDQDVHEQWRPHEPPADSPQPTYAQGVRPHPGVALRVPVDGRGPVRLRLPRQGLDRAGGDRRLRTEPRRDLRGGHVARAAQGVHEVAEEQRGAGKGGRARPHRRRPRTSRSTPRASCL